MSFYDNRILPHLIHVAMRQQTFSPYRGRLAAGAHGRVLEIGIGSGLNLSLYPRAVTQVIGPDSSEALLQKTRAARSAVSYSLVLVTGSAEAIPLDSDSVNTARCVPIAELSTPRHPLHGEQSCDVSGRKGS